MIKKNRRDNLPNRFDIHEWAGAFGDVGLLLPLAFALCIFNGFAPGTLFLLWGAAYLFTGLYYRVPVSVQPLKAIAVLALAGGFLPQQLASTAFFYGVILVFISLTGCLRLLQPLFTTPIVRGVQVSVGVIFLNKAVILVAEKSFYLEWHMATPLLNLSLMAVTAGVLWYFQLRKRFPLSIVLIFGSILVSVLFGVVMEPGGTFTSGPLVTPALPDFTFLLPAFIYLIVPQLPLTIGNAVFAASDISHHLWKERARRVTPGRLGFTIGISNVIIGLLGGFPICHGSGGMAAHHQFGGRTGGTTIIIGVILVLVAAVTPLSHFIFYIPIPILGALLFITGLKMSLLIKSITTIKEIIPALSVVAVAAFTRNLFYAVILGITLEWLLKAPALINSTTAKSDHG